VKVRGSGAELPMIGAGVGLDMKIGFPFVKGP